MPHGTVAKTPIGTVGSQSTCHPIRPTYTACHINVPKKKDGGISVVAKKRSAIGTFF
jgi:hypothetical protein